MSPPSNYIYPPPLLLGTLSLEKCAFVADVVHAAVGRLHSSGSLLCCLLNGWHFSLLHLRLRLLRNPGSRPSARHLLVRGNVERDEKDEVGAQDDTAGDCCEWLSSASADVGKRWRIRAGEVVP